MMLLPMMKKRGLSLIGLLRGLTYGTDFTQGADDQVLYSVLSGYTTTGTNGTRGGTSAANSDDPTWTSSGASFDGGDMFSDLPYGSGVSDYIDTTAIFSIHARVYAKASGKAPIWSSMQADVLKGTEFLLSSGYGALFIQNLGGFKIASWSDASDNWHTFSVTGDASTWRIYVDGSQIDSGTAHTCPASTTANDIRSGYSYSAGYASSGTKYRALAICNVKHSDSEVAAIHAKMATLPNAS